ncbi:unnamed protein product [Bursaphelenchus okinawaensis]|uniref:Uncharacterized protein n=1 Tax=Bursaphelenchus okinawaensis TaxID=465554 RepID=A0A811LJM4_9BILA|nr:unnamed protein product [Bursaphelenchus okinawaensis]CAG9123673.1 unnamed protein product [Bursaphelenchus okinawaensis]
MVEKDQRLSERVLDFQPVTVDLPNSFVAVFEAVDYKPAKKLWELNVKLMEPASKKELGSKKVKWPHFDPPQQFSYDYEGKNLVWENDQDVAVLPVSTANGFNAKASSSTVESQETPKKNGRARRKSASQSKEQNGVSHIVAEFISTLKDNLDFNPLLEERLPRDQQVRAVKALSYYWQIDGAEDVLKGLVQKRFFDMWAINDFLTEKLTSGSAAINEPVVKVLLEQPSVLLLEDTFIQLAKAAANDEFCRKIIVKKSVPKMNPTKLIEALDVDDAIELLERLLVEYVYSGEATEDDIDRNLDTILFIITGLTDKLLWIKDEEQLTKLRDIQFSLKQTFKLCRLLTNVFETNSIIRNLPSNAACPNSDYKIVQYKVAKVTEVEFEEEQEEME